MIRLCATAIPIDRRLSTMREAVQRGFHVFG